MVMLPSVTILAQRSQTVTVTAVGSAVGTDVVAVKRAALYEAKRNALQEAGVPELVQSVTTLMLDVEEGSMLHSVATEVSLLMLDGKVRLKKEPVYTMDIPNRDNLLHVACTIRAEVVVEEATDETFRLRVEGLRNTYREGERVEMEITPFADCWVRIFWFDRATDAAVEGAMVYPDAVHYNDLLWKKERPYSFPALPREYVKGNFQLLEAFKQSYASIEANIIFVVALKKPIPYDGEDYSYESFINWLIKIPANQRHVYWRPIGIVEK